MLMGHIVNFVWMVFSYVTRGRFLRAIWIAHIFVKGIYVLYQFSESLHIIHIEVLTLTQKHHPFFFTKPHLKSANYQAPYFIQSPYILLFFVKPPKNWIFRWTPILLDSLSLTSLSYFKLLNSQLKFSV